jgi:DNA-binding transcriptional MerR regulator
MPIEASQRQGARAPEIPDKLYFRIGEVARLCDLPSYVLRFWESEFPQLKPNKSGTGQRLYRKRDVEMVLRIKRLLYDEGYTIAGARHVFQAENKKKGSNGQPELPLPQGSERAQATLEKVRTELRELLVLLSSSGAQSGSPARERRPRVSAAPKPNLFD